MQLWNKYTMPSDIKATYIGRGTKWGNPFAVTDKRPRETAAALFRKKLARALAAKDKGANELIAALKGVDHIYCTCAPKVCHGDCFVEIFNLIEEKGSATKGIRAWVKSNGFSFGPDTDGVDHINIYTKGKTKLGKLLTNMSDMPVNIPEHGYFMTLEGYWYWLTTGCSYEYFRDCNGFEAKIKGKTLPRTTFPDFKETFKKALKLRFDQNERLKSLTINSTLPFAHYYCYGDSDDTVIYPPYDWIVHELEYLRRFYQGTDVRTIIAGSRDIDDFTIVEQAIADSGFLIDEVVCGTANGVDTLGEAWGKANGKKIKYFPAGWETYGKQAGFVRNCQMGDYATNAIVVIKNNSKGSTQMYEYMRKLGKPVFRVDVS